MGSYGGDPSNMMLVGQSAGAHLAAMTLLQHCLMEVNHDQNKHENRASDLGKEADTWSVTGFKRFVGVSGTYNLAKACSHMGLSPRFAEKMAGGDPDACSPDCLLATKEWQSVAQEAAARLPPIYLFHGADDHLVPSQSSITFKEKLEEVGVEVTLDVRNGMNHTYPVIEGPMLRHDI